MAFQPSSSLCVSSRIAESTTGKSQQLTCHCVAPANPLESNSLQIKLSCSMSATGKKIRKPVLWVHSLTFNTCLNKLLYPMDIFPIPLPFFPFYPGGPLDKSAEFLVRMLALISHLFPAMFGIFQKRTNLPVVLQTQLCPGVSRQPRLFYQAPLLCQLKIYEE